MKTITEKEFDELSKLYKPENRCKDNEHDWYREVVFGGTGDYICKKCFLTANESEKEKFCF